MKPRDLFSLADAREAETFVTDTFNRRLTSQAEWKNRIAAFDNFVAGNWIVKMPDGREISDRPKIENRVVSFAEDTSRLAGSFMPTLRVEAPDEKSVEWAKKRESVLEATWTRNRMAVKMIPYFADLASTGVAAFKVWTDFKLDDDKRFATIKRVDPRGIYLPVNLAPGEDIEDVVVRRTVKVRTLAKLFEDKLATLDSRWPGLQMTDDVEVVYYCDDTTAIEVAMLPDREGGVVLYSQEHGLGVSPIVVGIRPSADGQLRGQFDTMIPIISSENRIWTYMIDYADQMVYAPIKKSGNVGDITVGPMSVIDVGDGDVQRMAPAEGSQQLFGILGQLEKHGRNAGVSPEARSGSVSQSIGSAAFVESLMGNLVTNIRMLHTITEDVLVRVNSAVIAVEETFCDCPRNLTGYSGEGAFAFNYTPTNLFKGDRGSQVTYGVGAGLDAFNRELRLIQRLRSGLVSQRWVREQLEGMEAVLKVERQMLDEASLQTLLAGLQQQAAMGNLEPLARFQMALDENINPLQVLHFIMAATIQTADAQAQMPQEPQAPDAAGEMNALQKGGIPGNAPNLPPLDQVMV